jgi:hypothetical protein
MGAVGIALYLKGRRARRVSYGLSSSAVIQPDQSKHPGLEVRYAGERIPRLTATRLIVWNTGTETVDAQDVSQVDPLRMAFAPETRLLSCGVTDVTRDPIGASARADPQGGADVVLGFAFLDAGDAFCLEVLHTAPPTPEPKLKGTIKGVKELRSIGTYVDIMDRGRKREVKGLVGCLTWLYYRLFLPIVVLFSVLICVVAWLGAAWHMNLGVLSRESLLMLGQISVKLFLPVLLVVAVVPLLLAGLVLALTRLAPAPRETRNGDSRSGPSG